MVKVGQLYEWSEVARWESCVREASWQGRGIVR